MESLVKPFRLVHKDYLEKIKEDATGSEDKIDCAIRDCHIFAREGKDWVYDVLSGNSSFKVTLHVLDSRTKLSRKFYNYARERTRVELAISRFNKVPEKVLQRSS